MTTHSSDQHGGNRAVLLLRLAGPLQSWGQHSNFNRYDTSSEPTKSGVIGLLAGAEGRTREKDITDLCRLELGIRVDQPGSLARDYHTISDYAGRPLPTAARTAKRIQKPTSPAKYTQVTQRYYLEDAVFVAAVYGERSLISSLADAVRSPGFPLALGRRACIPTQPIVLGIDEGPFEPTDGGPLKQALTRVPWQSSQHIRKRAHAVKIDLAATIENRDGDDILHDVPVGTFDPANRCFTTRRVQHTWINADTRIPESQITKRDDANLHDPFALLGW